MKEAYHLPNFWLDSCPLIEASRGYYAMDIAPQFWAFLGQEAANGNIAIPMRCYEELEDYGDELSKWVRTRKDTLFVEANEAVQLWLTPVTDYVMKTYRQNKSRKFLDGADVWIIAHARASGANIVTRETQVGADSQTPKIPNVARYFGIESVETWRMLRDLGFKFQS